MRNPSSESNDRAGGPNVGPGISGVAGCSVDMVPNFNEKSGLEPSQTYHLCVTFIHEWRDLWCFLF